MMEPSILKRLSSVDDLRVAKTSPVMEKVTILMMISIYPTI